MTERQSKAPRAWSYIAGEKGRNRVRVYERIGYGVWIDYRDETGKRVRHPLGHTDRERGKLEADEIAAKFRRQGVAPVQALTLGRLFEMYEKEVVPRKAETLQSHNRRAIKLFLRAFGAKRRPATLNRRDLDSYVERRRAGVLAHGDRAGKSVRDAVIEQDCRLLLSALNWATRAGDGNGGYLLERNPLAGLDVPREQSPARRVVSAEQFAAMRAAAKRPRVLLFGVLAWYTGHRSKSIRFLRWSDLDLEAGTVLWRGGNDKLRYEHKNPLHPEAVAALKRERARVSAIGDAFVFPSEKHTGKPAPTWQITRWWEEFSRPVDFGDERGWGWHAMRRAFANTLRNVALRDLKDLGGWKTEKTIVTIYQQPSEAAQRRGLDVLTTALAAAENAGSGDQRAQGTGTN